MRRVALAAVMGLTPIVALAWGGGCSDTTTTSPGGGTVVDPGGTFGAEVTINVQGRGRVTANVPGIDCPSDCFGKYVFSSANADGATGTIGLKAVPTPGGAFLGWTFEADPVGSRGRGPDNCNPVTRAGAQPAVNASAQEISLPFGETTGAPPKGQEGNCGAFTTVPLVYKVVARFDGEPPVIPDGGPPDGGDGGLGEIVFSEAQPGTTAREIGFSGSYLYWHWQTAGGLSGISYSTNASTSSVPSTGNQILSPSQTINLFEVDQYGVAYQTSSGSVYMIRTSNSPQIMNGVSPGTCSALAVDSSYNVYCRTNLGTLVQWTYPSYTAPITLFTSLPNGNDLIVESSFGPAYFGTTTSISSLPLNPTPDGGVASPTILVSGRSSPANLEANSSRFWWTEFSDTFYASSSKSVGSSAQDTNVLASGSLTFVSPDSSPSSSYFWVASSTAIYKAYYFGGTQTRLFRSGLSQIGGIAVNSQYVYWTQPDGTVRRASTLGF